MNKASMNAACASLVADSYESPKAEVVEIHSEGVLCASSTVGSDLSVENWEEDDSFSW